MNQQLQQLLSYSYTYITRAINNGAFCYVIAVLILIPVWFEPQMRLNSLVQDTLFIIDISESMSVRDVHYPTPRSDRLTLAKHTVQDSMASLPCGSRVALGLTAGEESVLLFEPLEICRHFPAIEKVISSLNRRARWIGDSKITDVTIKAIQQAQERNMNLVLLTDGDEMPRRTSLYMNKLAKHRGEVKGVLLGLGGDTLQPIPLFNEQDEVVGYWSQIDALTQGNYPDLIAYAHAIKRGETIPEGVLDQVNEHLSSFNKTIMESLSKASGFELVRVQTPDDAIAALNKKDYQRKALADRDARWIYALITIVITIIGWYWQSLTSKLRVFIVKQNLKK
ncbi:MAG: VWA domain-containing protein [Gammaproteobacteria bacterium]|nr:VWA domain-containing protein [Gammaproteobacteria bacterium]